MSMDRNSDRIWRCDCGGNHFVSLTAFDIGEKGYQETYLSFCVEDRPDGLWERIKAAFCIFRDGTVSSGDVLLTGRALREFQEEVTRLVNAEGECYLRK